MRETRYFWHMSTQTHAARWIPRDTFAARLALLRIELGNLTVEDAAQRCGLNRATWQTWERGSSPRNMSAVVAKIALATGADRDWLMWGGTLAGGPESDDGLPRLDSNQKPPGYRSVRVLALTAA